ncbi:MAG: cyclic nucleotide-binding domain-containing protein [Gammaproteobacteria bacterium]
MKLDITPHRPEDRHRIISMLKKLPLFAGLHDQDFTHLCDLGRGKTYAQGTTVFQQGDHSHSLFVLLAGKIELATQANGLVYEALPGDFFGEIGFITQGLRAASATAVRDAVIMEISTSDYTLLLGQHPRICAVMMQHIAENLAQHLLRANRI